MDIRIESSVTAFNIMQDLRKLGLTFKEDFDVYGQFEKTGQMYYIFTTDNEKLKSMVILKYL
jgi:hypothetical protein